MRLARAAFICGLALATLLGACAPAAAPQPSVPSPKAPSAPSRTLVIAVRVEPASVASRALREQNVALHTPKRLFNADLALLDERGLAIPYLAEALPQLHSDSWRVFPDGRMETTYRLRPNLTWHDGTPLVAEDFIFSRRVYGTPTLGLSSSVPFGQMDEVVALDDRTVVIRWREPYPAADALAQYSFPPLPRHILEQSFQEDSADAFGNHLYWTREYVGLGPFRVARWEPGAFIEAAAFDGHVLGRPKIERIQIVPINDANAVLANLLSETVHLSDASIGSAQTSTLRREWEPRQAGSIHLHPNQWSAARFQFRPELVNPRTLLDVRVRRALAHALDKPAINDVVYENDAVVAETMIPQGIDYYAAIEAALPKYPYDLGRSERLMNEVGFSRGADGFYASPADGRFTPEVRGFEITPFSTELAVIASAWRQAGLDVQETIFPFAQAQDNHARATYSGIFIHPTGNGESAMVGHASFGIPRAENRWTGGNRGGWSNAEYDRLVAAFRTTLDRNERIQQAVQLTRIFSEEVAAISLFHTTQAMAHVAALRGPRVVASTSLMSWDIFRWQFD